MRAKSVAAQQIQQQKTNLFYMQIQMKTTANVISLFQNNSGEMPC